MSATTSACIYRGPGKLTLIMHHTPVFIDTEVVFTLYWITKQSITDIAIDRVSVV